MVNGLTTLAKVSDQDLTPVRVTVDLTSLLAEVLVSLEAVAKRAGVALGMDQPDAPCLMTGDPEQLSSALTNVVDNAVKYSDPGGRVDLTLRREGPYVVITCRDEGLGISEEDRAALFTPFFRSSNPDALARPGTGLGLDIVKGVVDRHKGQIAVESDLGVGTTMRLVLPVQEPVRE